MKKRQLILRFLLLLASSIASIGGVMMFSRFFLRPNVLGASTQITRLNKDYFLKIPTERYPHFYELIPNVILKSDVSFVPSEISNTINSDGIHSAKNYAVTAPSDTFRIATIGDSFTFGQFVATDQNYSSRLEQMINTSRCLTNRKTEIINFGIPGYDIGYTVEHFKRKAQKYAPDLVIWFLNTHNIVPLDERIVRFQTMVAETKEKRSEGPGGVDPWLPVFIDAGYSILGQWGNEAIQSRLHENIEAFRALYTGELVVVVNDTLHDLSYVKMVAQEFKGKDHIVFDDTLPDLSARNAILADGHPNLQGHIIIATHLYALLRQNGIISCHESN